VNYTLRGKRVWVAGHRGMVGSALVRRFASEGCKVLTIGREALNLTRQELIEAWLARERPEAVFLAAARGGGMLANEVEGFSGRIEFDASKPDGTPRKLMSNVKLRALEWRPCIGLAEWIRRSYAWYLAQDAVRGATVKRAEPA